MDSIVSRSRRRRPSRASSGTSPTSAGEPPSSSANFLLAPAFETSFQGGLQTENQHLASGGASSSSSLWGSRPKSSQQVESSFVADISDIPPRTEPGAQYHLPPLSPGYGGATTSLFTPMHILSPQRPVVTTPNVQPHQQHQQLLQNLGSGFNWQSLLGGQTPSFLQGFAFGPDPGVAGPSTSVAPAYIHPEENWIAGGRDHGHGQGTSDLSLGDDSSDSEEEEPSKGGMVRAKGKSSKRGSHRKERRRTPKGPEKRDVKREGSRDIQDVSHTPRDATKLKKRKQKLRKSREGLAASESGQLEDSTNFELSASSSETGSSSDDSDRDKKEALNKKRKRAGQDADGNVTWTDESVRFLFETYDAIHQRLWEESNGQVKYQKKWTPILKAMQDRFGKHFSKKQCQSKYWSVRRECTDYRNMSAKAARSDPSWNPSIAGRELLKPKFYDVWFEVSGKKQGILAKSSLAKAPNIKEEGHIGHVSKSSGHGESWRLVGKDGQPMKHNAKDCGSAMKEMQRLMQVQLQASEKREEAMKHRAELMMDILTSHMEHVEKRVSNLEEGRQPQMYLLDRVNQKLEKVLEGFTALNDNLSIIAYKITQKHSS